MAKNSALSIGKLSALNRGKYLSQTVEVPRTHTTISVATHFETAATDLPHYHETPHLSLMLRGGAIDKRKNMETECQAGELMFFYAGEVHRTIYRGFPVKSLSVELEETFFDENRVSETGLKAALDKNPRAKFTLLKIYKEMLAGDEFSESSIEMLTQNLAVNEQAEKNTHPEWLKTVAELLHDKWDAELSLSDMAFVAGVHPKTVSKYFPRYFGCTLGEFRRRLKIEKALPLLKIPGLSITDVAYQCNFFDQSHFTRIFKELTGFRPKQFKKI